MFNFKNLNVTELGAQEKVDRNAGGGWWGALFDLYYGGGAGEVHYMCGQAVNGHLSGETLDASTDHHGVQV